jgi:hypothetical protein
MSNYLIEGKWIADVANYRMTFLLKGNSGNSISGGTIVDYLDFDTQGLLYTAEEVAKVIAFLQSELDKHKETKDD